ncbi:MAG: AtpZ/AtpI family protein [Betaproteobacteria bacterium]|nr:AtpZ/AtpI family protein [Betaproteobacteria bacterium]
MSREPVAGHEEFERQVEKEVGRLERAEKERRTVLGQTVYIGVLGLLFVLPVIGGAYVGRWLDGFFEGYSMRWTLSLIFAGVVIGAVNVYFFIRE